MNIAPDMRVKRTDVDMVGVVLWVGNGYALVDFGSEDTTYPVPVNMLANI